ncbi:MAG: hypothetical protein AB1756_08920 [Acidobacteriota bacterium]
MGRRIKLDTKKATGRKPGNPIHLAEKKITPARKPPGMTLEQWQVELRRQYAIVQNFKIKNIGNHQVFSEFLITNPATERTYRVAIRRQGYHCRRNGIG